MPQLDLAPQNNTRRVTIPHKSKRTSSHVMLAMPSAHYGGIPPCRKQCVAHAISSTTTEQCTTSMPSIACHHPPTSLRTRISCAVGVKTTGITETTFKVGESTYELFDVGGRQSERIHCFENMMALVFLVSLGEYDQMLYEDESVVCLLPPFVFYS